MFISTSLPEAYPQIKWNEYHQPIKCFCSPLEISNQEHHQKKQNPYSYQSRAQIGRGGRRSFTGRMERSLYPRLITIDGLIFFVFNLLPDSVFPLFYFVFQRVVKAGLKRKPLMIWRSPEKIGKFYHNSYFKRLRANQTTMLVLC